MNINDYLKINYLKNNHKMIHYFGLGFIQVKIDDFKRMHFYTKELPSIMSIEDVHNHRYNFKSIILKGFLHQNLYQEIPGNDYIKEQESCKEGYACTSEPKECNIKSIATQFFTTGSEYSIDHETFHQVDSGNCITFIIRSNYKKEFADVIRKKDSTKVCPFSKKVPENDLWLLVEQMLKGVTYPY